MDVKYGLNTSLVSSPIKVKNIQNVQQIDTYFRLYSSADPFPQTGEFGLGTYDSLICAIAVCYDGSIKRQAGILFQEIIRHGQHVEKTGNVVCRHNFPLQQSAALTGTSKGRWRAHR